MAYNGILEAFFASVCTPADLQTQSRMMAGASLSLVATALAGSRLFDMGDTALVWANTVSMAVRALYAWRFVQRYCSARGQPTLISWSALPPPWGVLFAFAYDGVKLSVMEQKGHIAVGGVCMIVCLLSW
jgi:oligosaccharide translocation protein RFT1